MFIEDIDKITGERSWRVEEEDYDLAQEIARSGFGDMLHDTERNQLYDRALKSVIKEAHDRGDGAHVVDIGTGTSLLSLMAARNGADKVTAIEVFKPMADCAKKIIASSKYASKIDLITTRSTDIANGDVEKKGNIIVAEVFDTELIGEGALRTFKEAHETLVRSGSRVIPSSARVWIVPVESDYLLQFHRTPSHRFKTPFGDCPGAPAVFDLQLSQVPTDKFKMLCEPFVAFSFDFENADSIKYDESLIRKFEVTSKQKTRMDAVMMWWDLDMDGTGKYIMSMAPTWWDNKSQWRDHWMQAVYYLPKPVEVEHGDSVDLRCTHDEYSMWFSVEESVSERRIGPPSCTCGMHVLCSRNAMFRMNQLEKNASFIKFIKKECSNKSIVCINEGSFVGLTASQFSESVSIIEPNAHFRAALHKYCTLNGIKNVQLLASEEELKDDFQCDLILSEPYFASSVLPWDNIRYWYILESMRKRFGRNIKTFPQEGVLYGMPVKFDHLWKISAPVGTVEGFDLSQFDAVCQTAHSAVDAIVEPQPLWEYDSISTGDPVTIAKFNMEEHLPTEDLVFHTLIPLESTGTNAIALWMDWKLGDYRMRTGLELKCELGDHPKWLESHRQGVYLLPGDKKLSDDCREVHCSVKLTPSDGNFRFRFMYRGVLLNI